MATRRQPARSSPATPRTIWRGAITFGLVHVPVVLHPATRPHTLDLDLIDRRDYAAVGYRHYNKTTGKEVARQDIVKGYALLRAAMQEAGRVALATLVIRNRQHFAAVAPDEGVLLLTTLRYADEIRPLSGLRIPTAHLRTLGVTSREIGMATQLIEDMADKWKPREYKDTYRDDLLARIRRKVRAGRTHALSEPPAAEQSPRPTAEIIDLAALLKKSLRGGKAQSGTRASRRPHHTRPVGRHQERRRA